MASAFQKARVRLKAGGLQRVADLLGIPKVTAAKYDNGDRQPPPYIFAAMEHLARCASRNGDVRSDHQIDPAAMVRDRRIARVLRDHDVPRAVIADLLGVTPRTVSRYWNEGSSDDGTTIT